jgi:serine/threonine-protein kinase
MKTLTKTTAEIGKYRLETEIGRGCCAQVFRAFDSTVGRTVAIKLLTECGKDALPRFKREAAAAEKLCHKNIVTIYDYGEQDNTPYLVMEYLEGITLNTILSSRHNSTLFERTSVMTQVAEGLQHAHQQGVVHGDVRPVNIMILSDGTVKIMDFGMAGVLSELEASRTRSAALRSLSYTAPQVLQYSEVDGLSDIFSFGVIYYELITGTHPFAADDRARVIYKITLTEPPLVSTLAPCPHELEQMITRAIHKDRELRYQSFEDVLFDLMPIRLRMQLAETQTLIRKAETLVDAKHIAEAHTLVQQVLQLDPSNRLARELREKLKREAQMQEVWERCKQLIVSGTVQLNSLQESKAIESFETVLRLDPNNVDAQKLLEQARTSIHKRERAQALIAQARRELEAHQLSDAYQRALECLQDVPENKDAAALLETIRAAIKARECQRRLAKGLARAKEMFAAGHFEEAEALLSELEVSYPDVLSIKQLKAEVSAAVEEKKRRRQRQLELQRKAKHVKTIRRETISANEAHEFERALQLINDGLRLYPDEPALKMILARTEELRNEHQRRSGIQAGRQHAIELTAKNDFSAALAVIDSTADAWNTDELTELRRQIQTKQEEVQRVQAIAEASASIKNYLDSERYEDALTAGQQALAQFPEEPSITALVNTAQACVAEQIRQARIDAIYEEAMVVAAEDGFSEALELLRDAIREFGDDRSLIALHEEIEARKKRHDRQQAIAAAAAAIRTRIEQADYEAAAEAGRLALENFPGETVLTKLVETAQRLLAEQRRAAQIAMIQHKARSLASAADFDSALRLVLDTIDELGSEPTLEELAQWIERLREKHQEQEARRLAATKAKQLMESTEFAKAIALLEENVEKYSDDGVMKDLLTEAREQLAAHRSKAIDAIVRKARDLVRAQEFQTALNLTRYGIREYSDDSRLNAMVTEIRSTISEVEKERTIRAALNSAAVLQEQGEFSKAAELLEHTLTKAPSQTVIQQALAFAKRQVAAQQKIDAVLGTARELMSHGHIDDALTNVRQALDAFPGEPSLSSLFEEISEAQRSTAIATACPEIQACRSAGNIAEASRMLEEALAAFPNEPTLLAIKLHVRSEIEAQQKRQSLSILTAEVRHLLDDERVDDAIGKLQDALRESPESVELTGLYAYAKEIVQAHRAVEISDLAKRSMILLQSNKPRDAESVLKDALKSYPEEQTLLSLLDRARTEIATPHPQHAGRDLGSDTKTHAETRATAESVIAAAAPALGTIRSLAQPKGDERSRIAIVVSILVMIFLLAWIVLPQGKKTYTKIRETAVSPSVEGESSEPASVERVIPGSGKPHDDTGKQLTLHDSTPYSSFVCSSGELSRTIVVRKFEPGEGATCDVSYDTERGQSTPWSAERDAGYCSSKAFSLALKLDSLGWSCLGR